MAANVAEATPSQQQQQTRSKHTNELETQSSKLAGNRIDNSLADISNGNGNGNSNIAADAIVVYDVEHLATFSTSTSATNGSHEATNNRSKKQQANNDSKSKPTATSGLSSLLDNDDDDPATAATSASASASEATLSANALAGRGRTSGQQFDGCGITTPRVALRRLFELEKLSGIWTQRMQIELRQELMLIVDCETNSVVEKFDKHSVTKPEAFNEYNHIYNNIVVFVIRQPSSIDTNKERDERDHDERVEGELHIFQCVSQQAQQLVQDILDWKASKLQVRKGKKQQERASGEMAKLISNSQSKSHDQAKDNSDNNLKSNSNRPTDQSGKVLAGASQKPMVTVASSSSANENVPVVNVNVKETVQVFNQIAALREKSKPASPTSAAANSGQQRPLSDASAAGSTNSSSSNGSSTGQHLNKQEDAPLASLEGTGASFFKQRSIRAKLSAQDQQKQQQQQKLTNSTDSTIASCSSSSDQTKPHQQQNDTKKHQEDLATSRHNNNNNSNNNMANSSSNSSNASSSNRSSGGFLHQSSKHNYQPPNGHRASQDSGHTQANSSAAASSSAHQQKGKSSSSANRSTTASQRLAHLDQVTTNESYVSVLNHCFDDIEKFILKLQQAMAASRELQQAKRKLSKRSSSMDAGAPPPTATQFTATEMALLGARARGPSEEDYFEILSKFKLAFNLLAKLKGCIHEPNAPELVHFLFTPLAIIIESARNAKPAIDPTLVGIPYLNQEALDLLSNCCTSKEYDMWMSLGPNWIQTIDSSLLKASRLPSSFQPIFSDGWAPIIGELELIGLVVPSSHSPPFDYSQQLQEIGEQPQSERQHRHRHKHDHPARPRHPSASGYSSALPADSLSPPTSGGHAKTTRGHARNGHALVGRHLSEPAVAGYGHELYNNYADPTIEARLNGTTSPFRSSREIYHRPLNAAAAATAAASTAAHLATHLYRVPTGSSNRSGSVERRPNPLRIASGNPSQRPLSQSKSSTSRAKDFHHHPSYHHAAANRFSGRDYDELLDNRHHNHQPHDTMADHHLHYPMMGADRSAPAAKELGAPMKPYSTGKQRHLYDGPVYPAPDDESGHYFAHADDEDLHHHHPTYKQHRHQHESMLIDLGPAQLDWFYELQSRGAMIVRVLFSRAANNDKELSVRRGEILEILDDSRKWWRARNIELQVAHVPHTIVAPMQDYQTLDDLLANNPAADMPAGVGAAEDPSFLLTSSSSASMHYARHPTNQHHGQQAAAGPDDWHGGARNSKNATGAFRYF